MPNYCDFRLRGNGPVQYMEEFTAHWDGMLRDAKGEPDPNGFTTRILDYRIEYPEVPESDFVPYYDSAYMGCRIENGLVVIDAISNGGPPISLLCAMSSRWPELEFVLQCTVEHEQHERWHFKAGDVAIIDLWMTNIQAHEDDERECWFVRDGKLLKWPDWHTAQWKGEVFTQRIPDWAFIPESPDKDDFILLQEAAEEIVGDFELAKWKSTRVDGIVVEPNVAFAELKKKFDAKVEGFYELVFGFENYSIVQRWRFRDGKWQLLDCLYEGEGEQIVFMKNGKQLNGLPEWVAADDQPDFLKLFGLWEKA